MTIKNNLYNDIVVANIASIPDRFESFFNVIDAVLPQVDLLNIILSKYQSIPLKLQEVKNEKINIIFDSEDKWQERSKFLLVDKVKGYYFTIDDDIIYPHDYVEKMINAVEFYKRKAIVCVHASDLNKKNFNNYYSSDSRTIYSFIKATSEDKIVDIAGTGTVAFHTSTINLSINDFKSPYMSDLWLSYTAQMQKVPIISIKRANNWLKFIYYENNIGSTSIRDKELLEKKAELSKEIIKNKLVA